MKKIVKIKTLVMALASAGLASIPGYSLANPTGGQVVAGNATIRQESATKVGITQTTDKAIIDWQKFSIGANEHVQYYQPSAASVTLNRVVGQDPSQILGRLTANGQVFLVNPNGIYFGKDAQIDVAGLVASTHNIRNEDFMAGEYLFNIPGKPGASVINEGQIRIADTGIAAFVAPSVANRGVIAAKLGKVALASANGFTLDFHGDELLTFMVADEVAQTAFDLEGNQLTSFVENSGKIQASGGYVLLTAKAAENAIHNVINQSGLIEATSVGQQNGEIILSGGQHGVVSNTGTLDASGKAAGQTGGKVQITGEKIDLFAGTLIDVSGDQGGGKAIVGGDYLGGQASDALMAELGIQRESKPIQTATFTNMAKEAVINADARLAGNGGKVIIWSDVHTNAFGVISAMGGKSSGNGGFVETSGNKSIDIGNITVNAGANRGESGVWLTDPESQTIDAATALSISNALNTGTKTISRADSIFINSDIVKSAGGNSTFTLNSAWIYLQEGVSIRSTSNKLNIKIEATDRVWIGRGFIGGESEITSNGGDILLHGPNFVGVNGRIDAGSGNLTIKAENKNSTGVDRGIWVFGSTTLSGASVSLLTSDTLKVDELAKIKTNQVIAQIQGQIDQISKNIEKTGSIPGYVKSETYEVEAFFGVSKSIFGLKQSFGYLIDDVHETLRSDGSVKMEFPVFNNRPLYATVEVLDEHGNIVDVQYIAPKFLNTSITDDVKEKLWDQFTDGKDGFKDSTISKETKVEIIVPKGGTVRVGYGGDNAFMMGAADQIVDAMFSLLGAALPDMKVSQRQLATFASALARSTLNNTVKDLMSGNIDNISDVGDKLISEILNPNSIIGAAWDAMLAGNAMNAHAGGQIRRALNGMKGKTGPLFAAEWAVRSLNAASLSIEQNRDQSAYSTTFSPKL